MRPAEASAPARAALAGNPSDGYRGRTLAVALAGLGARVRVEPAPGQVARFDGVAGFDAALAAGGPPALLAAAAVRFGRHFELPESGFALRTESNIPPEVGLAGSSAIVVAALRAMCQAVGASLDPRTLALLALEAETEELGIAAGPQDRVTQAYGGLVAMDFAPEHGPVGIVERLDPSLLPPLFVAWRRGAAAHSGDYHAELRRRHAEGDPAVSVALRRLARLAAEARDALVAGDAWELARCMDASFDARASMGPLPREHVEMVRLARALGAGANFAGSGGAIVATLPAGTDHAEIQGVLERAACTVMAPVRAAPAAPTEDRTSPSQG